MLSPEEIQKLAKLSRLEVSTEEIPELQKHFSNLLEHLDDLKLCNVEGLDPMTTVDEKTGFLREDKIGDSLDRANAFLNAPSEDQGHFSIPKVIG